MEVDADLAADQGSLFEFFNYTYLSSYLFSQPNLKCTQFAKYKKEYEDQINLAEANIDEAVRQCDAVVAKHEALLAEKGELELALAGTYI